MKIFCFIMNEPPLRYFVNTIQNQHKIDLVVVEGPNSFWGKLRWHGIYGSYLRYKDLFFYYFKYKKNYNRYFKESWKEINPSIPRVYVNNINDDIVRDIIIKEKPDIILVHGTRIIKKHIIESAKLILNLHWGLSPYYRGTHCTDWALINWDPYNIGVTIHLLTSKIDGGDIIAQKRAEILPGDTVHSINMQLTSLGTELIIEILKRPSKNKKFTTYKQDFSWGYLTCIRQWSAHLEKQIRFIEKKNIIGTMLKFPSRKELLDIHEI